MKQNSKKQEILEHCIDIFVDEGYDRPTMDFIAKSAGVSKRTLYKHYPSKRALLDAIILFLLEQKHSLQPIDFSLIPETKDQIRAIVEEKVKQFMEPKHLKLAKIIVSETLKGNSILTNPLIDNVVEREAFIASWIREKHKAKLFDSKKDEMMILTKLNELLFGIVLLPKMIRDKEITEDDISSVTEFFYIYVTKPL